MILAAGDVQVGNGFFEKWSGVVRGNLAIRMPYVWIFREWDSGVEYVSKQILFSSFFSKATWSSCQHADHRSRPAGSILRVGVERTSASNDRIWIRCRLAAQYSRVIRDSCSAWRHCVPCYFLLRLARNERIVVMYDFALAGLQSIQLGDDRRPGVCTNQSRDDS